MRLDLISERDLPVTIGRYTLTGILGEGGMARVFRAKMEGALGFTKPAAVKVVLPAHGDRSESLRQQLIQEARLGGLLNHPNVIQTFDCGELEGFPYIAMELVEGAGLDDLVQEVGPLPPAAVLDVALQVARGLHHAHTASHEGQSLEIIHRDVKPSNVLIREDGVVKVMDFGIAKVSMTDSLSTATGMTKGTPSYMSPEQLAADNLDSRTDLFALGAVLYYALTGKTLFTGSSLTEVMLRIIQVDETIKNTGILAQADQLLPGFGAVLGKLLVKDRSARYQTAGDLERELAELRRRHPADDKILARLVGAHFGSGLADARTKAASVSGPSPIRRGSDPEMGVSDGPGPTRSFPATGRSKPGLVLPPTVDMPRVTPQEAWVRGRVDDGSGPPPLSTQTKPQFPAQRGEDGGGRPRRRKRSAPAPAPQRQGVLLVVGIGLGLLVAVLMVLLLRGRTAPDPAPVAVEVPSPAPIEPLVAPSVPGAGVKTAARVAEPRTPKPRTPEPRTPEPRTPEPRVVHEPATAAPPRVAAPAPTPTPAPAPAEAASPRLSAEHVPVKRATMGTSKALTVTVDGPADTQVTLFWGPVGGPHQSAGLDPQGSGVWKGTLPIEEQVVGGLEYWILVKHRGTTPRVVALGRQSDPYQVAVY